MALRVLTELRPNHQRIYRYDDLIASRRVAHLRNFSPLVVPGLLAWFDLSDLSNLFRDQAMTMPVTADGDTVGAWRDRAGTGSFIYQSTEASKPIYRASGGVAWLEFDGANDYLGGLFTVPNPFSRVSGIRPVDVAANDQVFGGGNLNSGVLFAPVVDVLRIYDGSIAATLDQAVAAGGDYVVTEIHQGAGSSLQVDDLTPGTGHPGSGLAGGLRIGTNNLAQQFSGLRCYGLAMYGRALLADEAAQLKAFFRARMPPPVPGPGPEILLDPELDGPTGWTFGAGWAQGVGEAVATLTTTSLTQPISLITGRVYRVVHEVLTRTNGATRPAFGLGSTVVGAVRTAPGVYTDDMLAAAGNAEFRMQGVSGGFTGTVGRVSLKLMPEGTPPTSTVLDDEETAVALPSAARTKGKRK